MRLREPPRLALALLERVVPDSAHLAGDLHEEYERRPSRWRVWREVLAAIAIAWLQRSDDIRPLRLVDLQPADAIERTRRLDRRITPVSLNASPLAGVGGLTTVVLALVATLVMPAAWWLIGISILGGVALGVAMILDHRDNIG
jgi:hypothetical protein